LHERLIVIIEQAQLVARPFEGLTLTPARRRDNQVDCGITFIDSEVFNPPPDER
jgi:hypothetical protein